MELKIVKLPALIGDINGNKTIIIDHIYLDAMKRGKHRLINPFKIIDDLITKASINRDLQDLSIRDNLPYEIDNEGRLYITIDNERVYFSEDLKCCMINGEVMNIIVIENEIYFGPVYPFNGSFPYKFLYTIDKEAYQRKERKVVDITDYLRKRGR